MKCYSEEIPLSCSKLNPETLWCSVLSNCVCVSPARRNSCDSVSKCVSVCVLTVGFWWLWRGPGVCLYSHHHKWPLLGPAAELGWALRPGDGALVYGSACLHLQNLFKYHTVIVQTRPKQATDRCSPHSSLEGLRHKTKQCAGNYFSAANSVQ